MYMYIVLLEEFWNRYRHGSKISFVIQINVYDECELAKTQFVIETASNDWLQLDSISFPLC